MIFIVWLVGFIIVLSIIITLVKNKRIDEKWINFEVAESPLPIFIWILVPVFWIISIPVTILVIILSKFIKSNK